MELYQSWKDSIKLLEPESLKLFLLATVNAIKQAYMIMLKNFWWYFLLNFVVVFFWLQSLGKHTFLKIDWTFLEVQKFQSQHILAYLGLILIVILTNVYFILWVLATRPSIERKTVPYFMSYLKEYWLAIVLLMLIPILGSWWSLGILIALFTFDSQEKTLFGFLKACAHALIFCFYNFPLYIAALLFKAVIVLPFMSLFFFLPHELIFFTFFMVYYLVILPVMICLFSNLYIKRIHEQPELYN